METLLEKRVECVILIFGDEELWRNALAPFKNLKYYFAFKGLALCSFPQQCIADIVLALLLSLEYSVKTASHVVFLRAGLTRLWQKPHFAKHQFCLMKLLICGMVCICFEKQLSNCRLIWISLFQIFQGMWRYNCVQC